MPILKKRYYDILHRKASNVVRFWQQFCLNWPVVTKDLQRLSKVTEVHNTGSDSLLLYFRDTYRDDRRHYVWQSLCSDVLCQWELCVIHKSDGPHCALAIFTVPYRFVETDNYLTHYDTPATRLSYNLNRFEDSLVSLPKCPRNSAPQPQQTHTLLMGQPVGSPYRHFPTITPELFLVF